MSIEMPTHANIDTLVHLGAGACNELDAHLARKPKRMLLVEADPQLAEALQARTASLQQVQVQCAAVAAHEGFATFHRFNLPYAGSLHAATGLRELFPGLRTVDQLKVETISPVTLLQPLQLQPNQENLLIVDLPGEELAVLKALQQGDQLFLFRQLQLHCGRQPLYENSEPAATVLRWLQEQGFDLIAEEAGDDPDRPRWSLRRNALQLRNRQLQRQVDRLSQERDEQNEKAKTLEQRQALLDQTNKTLNEHAKLVEQSKKELGDLKMELVDAHRTASLTAKLLTLREADLRDLQDRYQESLSTQKKQHELLVRLGERLSAASTYFHQLANSQAVSLPSNGAVSKKRGRQKRGKEKKEDPAGSSPSRPAPDLSKPTEGGG
jgi:FkbM family methyltransferase